MSSPPTHTNKQNHRSGGEGLEASWARHRTHHLALRAGLEAMGLSLFVREEARLPQLNAVNIPDGAADLAVRKLLLEDFRWRSAAAWAPWPERSGASA